MPESPTRFEQQLAAAIDEYRASGHHADARQPLQHLARQVTPDALVVATEPYLDDPHVVVPLYEVIVETSPGNARGLVVLANALWLLGAGPEAVQELATRAISVDPANRGAWHLWSLSESDPRARTVRWRQVAERFPADDLALANVADNAASVAGAEHDYEMLDIAIAAYETLLSRATRTEQRDALDTALRALRGWKF
jgi:hypothetical protein